MQFFYRLLCLIGIHRMKENGGARMSLDVNYYNGTYEVISYTPNKKCVICNKE